MKFPKGRLPDTLAILIVGLASFIGWTIASAHTPDSAAKDRAVVLLSQALPKLDGDHLHATLVEVTYGPGEGSPPHSHACPLFVHVVEGALRTQVQGQPEAIFKAGESFYESAEGVHLISANASATAPAKFVALFVCDHQTPLSTNVPDTTKGK